MVVAISHDVELLGVGLVLQEARLRQGVSLEEVEAHTCIRRANLEAIEEERFDALPGDVYGAGFVRSYADFLELDSDRLVDAFWAARPYELEPLVHDVAAPRARRAPLLAVGLAVLVVAAAVAAALLLRGGGAPAPAPPAPRPAAKPVAAPDPLTLRAVRGSSWVVVRHGGPHGALVWQGTLRQGRMLRFGLRRALWVGLGKPTAVTARIGTKRVQLHPDRSRYTFG
jgi:hypothetical protein